MWLLSQWLESRKKSIGVSLLLLSVGVTLFFAVQGLRLVLISTTFMALKPSLGILQSAGLVGAVVLLLGFVGLWMIQESYGVSMDFEEH